MLRARRVNKTDYGAFSDDTLSPLTTLSCSFGFLFMMIRVWYRFFYSSSLFWVDFLHPFFAHEKESEPCNMQFHVAPFFIIMNRRVKIDRWCSSKLIPISCLILSLQHFSLSNTFLSLSLQHFSLSLDQVNYVECMDIVVHTFCTLFLEIMSISGICSRSLSSWKWLWWRSRRFIHLGTNGSTTMVMIVTETEGLDFRRQERERERESSQRKKVKVIFSINISFGSLFGMTIKNSQRSGGCFFIWLVGRQGEKVSETKERLNS